MILSSIVIQFYMASVQHKVQKRLLSLYG